MKKALRSHGRITASLHGMLEGLREERVPLSRFAAALTGDASLVLCLFIALPFLSPIPLPGISLPFGLIIAWLGFRKAARLPENLPSRLMRHEISPKAMRRVLKATSKVIGFVERHARPSLGRLVDGPGMFSFNCFLIGLAGLVLAIPAPIPFINGLPAWWVVLLVVGTLEKDGRYLLAGYILYVLGTIYILLVLFLGIEFLTALARKVIPWL